MTEIVFVSGTDDQAGRDAVERIGAGPRAVRLGVHAMPGGLTDVVETKASVSGFAGRARERLEGGDVGLHAAFDSDSLSEALERLESDYYDDPVAAARTFLVAAIERVAGDGAAGPVVDWSPDNLRYAQILVRLIPEARFVSAVRDGRTAAVDGPRGLGLWEARIRFLDEGIRGETDGTPYALADDRLDVWVSGAVDSPTRHRLAYDRLLRTLKRDGVHCADALIRAREAGT